MLLNLWRNGRMLLEQLITRRLELDAVDDAFADLLEWRGIAPSSSPTDPAVRGPYAESLSQGLPARARGVERRAHDEHRGV